MGHQLATTEQRLNLDLTPKGYEIKGGACPFIAELVV